MLKFIKNKLKVLLKLIIALLLVILSLVLAANEYYYASSQDLLFPFDINLIEWIADNIDNENIIRTKPKPGFEQFPKIPKSPIPFPFPPGGFPPGEFPFDKSPFGDDY